MYIEVRTDELSEGDAIALAVLIHEKFPTVLGKLAFMMSATAAAINSRSEPAPPAESLSAEEAFAGDGMPTSVAPSAEEAFAGPPGTAGVPPATPSPGMPESVIPASTSSAAATTGTTGAASVGHVELDANGIPWDARIHGGGQKKTDGGVWTKKRGVSADLVAKVTAELKAALASPLASTTAAAPPAPASAVPTSSTIPPAPVPASPATATVPPVPVAPAVSAPPVPPAPAPATTTGAAVVSAATTVYPPEVARAAEAAVVAEVTAAPPAAPSAVAFTDVMRKVVDATAAGKLTPEDLNAVCASMGIATPRDLLTQPGLAPTFAATLDAVIASKG